MTMEEIKAANRKAGRFFFSPDTMLFFDSWVSNKVFTCEKGTFFVTCEGYFSLSRRYTVRFTIDGSRIESLEEFKKYDSLEDALSAAKKASEQGKTAVENTTRDY